MTIEPSPPLASGTCPLCTAVTISGDERCPTCNYVLAGVDGRPPAFSRATLWLSAAGFAVVYLVTLAIVALTR